MLNYSIERIEELRRKKTSNLYAVFAALSILVSGVFGLFFPEWIYGLVLLCLMPLLILVPVFNKMDKSAIAVAILIHVSNFCIIIYDLAYSYSTGSHAFIFPLIAGVSIINPLPKHRIELWVHLGLSVFLHIFIFVADKSISNRMFNPNEGYQTLEMVNYSLSIIVLIGILYQSNLKNAVNKLQLGEQLSQNNQMLDKLRSTVKEKEVLLAEVHHRVKNNLAIISGMLNLRRNLGKKTDVDAVLLECSNRVVSMALVHEKLYKTGDLNNIPFHDYVNDLCLDIHRTIVGDKHIELVLELDNLYLNIDKAIPVGLIINEVVTNSIKHAFVDKDKGEIKVQLKKQAESTYLMISDNGKGITEEFNPEKEESLGFMLIESLVQQIDGTFEFANNNGACFVLRFPTK